MRTNEYTVRSEGGGITGGPYATRGDAMAAAQDLAFQNLGQTIGVYRGGRPLRMHGSPLTWTNGPKAAVQR